jgi:hypothetical protein
MNNKFSIYDNVRATESAGEASAAELIEQIKSNAHKAIVDQIRSAPDKDTRSRYKARLPAVTASGVFSKRAASALITHSGILIADVDLDENPQLMQPTQFDAVRKRLCADSHIYFLFTSPSGGLKAGVKIDATCASSHKAAFVTVREWFAADHGLVIDKACSDVSRLCFLSHDPSACIKSNPLVIKTSVAAKEAEALPFWAPKPTAAAKEGTTPGDDFNVKADVVGMLQSNGWTTRNGRTWTRPGKTGGISGTLGVTADRQFWCWSSEAAPLEANKSYNPFALYAAFYHGGDYGAAATALAAEGYGEQDEPLDPAINASIEALVERALKKEADSWKNVETEIDEAHATIEKVAMNEEDEFLAALDALDASSDENLAAMKLRAQDAVFILPEIALVGDCTILNAGPNTGKTLMTLWLLAQRDIEATAHLNIYYINADDSFNGSIDKMEIVRSAQVKTLIPNQNGFDPANLSKIIKGAIKADACGKMVIILDTLKKFVSTMDKNDARVFNIMVRSFTQAGGTLIALAHTNKNKDADGKSIAEGVGDFQSDFDCAYTIDRAPVITEGAAMRTIVFENTKLRGPNAMKATFEYDAGEKRSWSHRYTSVRRIGQEEARAASEAAEKAAQREKDQPIIDYIMSELAEGAKSFSALSQNNLGGNTGSRKNREEVLRRYVGDLWGESKGGNGGWNYHKIEKRVGNLVRFGL